MAVIDEVDGQTAPAGGGAAIHTSAWAAPPGAPNAGDVWLPSDGFYALRYTGAAWIPWGPIFPMVLPVSGDFVWINQGGASIDITHGGIYLLAPALAGDNLRVRKKAAPAVPYSIIIGFLSHSHAVDYNSVGFVWRQSSDGKLIIATANDHTALTVNKYDDPTTYNASYGSIETHTVPVRWLKCEDNNTNRIVSWSADGQFWHEVHSVGRTDYLTADEVGIFANPNNATWPAAMMLLSWEEA